MSSAIKHLFINDQGQAFSGENPLEDSLAKEALANLHFSKEAKSLWTEVSGQKALVLGFDFPLIARGIEVQGKDVHLRMPHDFETKASLNSLFLDHWDRVCGLTQRQIPFVLSKDAQIKFFDLIDSFSDESITFEGMPYSTPPWKKQTLKNKPNFWSERYNKGDTPWELGEPHSYLTSNFHSLKVLKSQVLVLGSGLGHDAAYIASKGHFVTAIESCKQAHELAVEKYGKQSGLTLIYADALEYDYQTHSFDMIFEHTFYCALDEPNQDRLVDVWEKVLRPQGLLVGPFMLGHYRGGPPFSATQWELHRRLEPEMRRLYIQHWPKSEGDRKDIEHIVCFQKK